MESGGNNGGATTTTTGPRAKCDQVVFESIAKACEIIVLSRKGGTDNYNSKQLSSSSSVSRFNLQIPEIRAVRKVLAQFKCSLHVPLRLDVYYQHPSSSSNSNGISSDNDDPSNGNTNDNNNGGGRELLERWCIEYSPCHSTYFTEECNNLDPLIQLRHVCKKIVLWLRTLYCISKLLPCGNATNTCSDKHHVDRIGFSIYVSDESQYHDVEDLIRNTGFQQQGHSSVYTPYGRLDLSCCYAPRNAIQRLFPRQPTARWVSTPTTSTPTKTTYPSTSNNNKQYSQTAAAMSPKAMSPPSAARPIPTSNASRNIFSHSKAIRPNQQDFAPQSAPSHFPIIPNYTSSPVHHTHEQQQQQQQQQYLATTAPRPAGMTHYNSEKKVPQQQQHHYRNGSSRPNYVRAHSSSEYDQHHHQHPLLPEKQKEQKRVLSGLSLAMMNAEEDGEESNDNNDEPLGQNNDDDAEEEETDQIVGMTADATKSEQRRAALHHPPPTAVASQFPTTMGATPPNCHQNHHRHPSTFVQGEYGYAYNNHIPWGHQQQGKQGPSTPSARTSPMDADYTGGGGGVYSGSPGAPLLSATPPQPMFVGSTGNRSPFTPPVHHLLPPVRKNSNDSVTPPFSALPTTLLEPLKAPAMEYTACISSRHEQYQPQQRLTSTTSQHVLPPISSLDLLHMSPFKAQEHQQGSIISSLSGNVGGMGSELYLSKISPHESPFRGVGGITSAAGSTFIHQDEDDMPFAVDETSPSVPFASDGASQVQATSFMAGSAVGTNLDASTASAAFMAHKCATAGRLKLFDSQVIEARDMRDLKQNQDEQEILREEIEAKEDISEQLDPVVSSLADQLAEFRSFGASLAVASDHGSAGGAASTSTPISLKT